MKNVRTQEVTIVKVNKWEKGLAQSLTIIHIGLMESPSIYFSNPFFGLLICVDNCRKHCIYEV